MSDLPSGTVTFLFTDIEGSTALAQQFPAELPALLARHHAILQHAIQTHNGYVFQIIGDAFCAAFYTASDALQAALEAQRALQQETWNPAPIKVRMGLHTGAAQAGVTEERAGGYVGYLTLTRVQRAMSVAYGGQVLLSNPTAELVRGDLPADVTLRDMGEHRLKGLLNPEHLWQLVAPDVRQDFPPLPSLNTLPNNLPAQLTSFIGREKELARIREKLAKFRLVTLTGSGGVGKTRLSIQAAYDCLPDYHHGAWLIELAPLTDPALVPQAIVTLFGLPEDAARSPVAVLTDYLREKTLLLLLDNCEHVIDACAQLAEQLLRHCPNLRILASSREALGLDGEAALRVPSLSLPPADAATRESLSQSEAAQLFIERAAVALPGFVLTEANAPAIAQVCRRLDGIALAIELAASRVKVLRVEQIADRLDDAFRLLTGGRRTALPRQQTLRATIDWSYNLLTDAERTVLRRLSVFAGGATLEATEAVCADGVRDDTLVCPRVDTWINSYDVLDILTQLVNKSLVAAQREQGIETRYTLLETIRQYARERLSESGEADAIRAQHLDFFFDLARRAEPELQGADQSLWLDRLEVEIDNIRAALEWSLEGAERGAERGLRMASHLWWFWFIRNYPDGGEWLEKTLLACQTSTDHVTRAAALARLVWVRFFDDVHAEEGLMLGRTLGLAGRESVALALLGKGAWAWYQADYARAKSLAEESLGLFREIGYRFGICEALTWLGMALINLEDYQQAEARLEESLALARRARDGNEIGFAVWQLGRAAMLQGDYTQAAMFLQEGLKIYRELKQFSGVTFLLNDLGKAALLKGDYQQAALYFKESLSMYWKSGYERNIASGLEQLASVAVADRQPEQAARLLGAAQALRESSGAIMHPYQLEYYEPALESLRLQLDKAAFAAQWAAGRAMPPEQAIAYALKED